MERSSEEAGSRRRTRSMRSEAVGAKTAEGNHRRSRRRTCSSTKSSESATASSEEGNRILKLESEADREILMKVKSEEGKILKLKKEYVAASEAGLLPPMEPTVKAAQPQPAGKKTKKVVVKRLMTLTKAQVDFFKVMAAHPGPVRNLTEHELTKLPKSYQYTHRQIINSRNKRLAYIGALVHQQEEFGHAVDESEVEVTDDDDEGDN